MTKQPEPCPCGYPARLLMWSKWSARYYEVVCSVGHKGGVRSTEKEALNAWKQQNKPSKEGT